MVVCVHNALAHVRRCLTSVLAHSSPELNRLIVVDDGSDTQTQQYLNANCSKLELIRNDSARGYTKAANQGLRQSDGRYVVLLNSDTEVPAGWLRRLVVAAESDPAVGMASPLSNAATWQSVPRTHSATGQWAVNQLEAGHTIESMDQLVPVGFYLRVPTGPALERVLYSDKTICAVQYRLPGRGEFSPRLR